MSDTFLVKHQLWSRIQLSNIVLCQIQAPKVHQWGKWNIQMHRHITKTIRYERPSEKCSRTDIPEKTHLSLYTRWRCSSTFSEKESIDDTAILIKAHLVKPLCFALPICIAPSFLILQWPQELGSFHGRPTCIQLPSYFIPTSHCRPWQGRWDSRAPAEKSWKVLSSAGCGSYQLPRKTGAEEGRVHITSSEHVAESPARAAPVAPATGREGKVL